MGSSEEYLDSLLKSLMEDNNDASDEPVLSDAQTSTEAESANDVMNMDDIEAMFASMGAETTEEEPVSDELSLDELSLDDLSLDEMLLSEEAAEASAAEEETVPDELSLDELPLDDLSLDDLSLDDTLMSEEAEEAVAAEEETMPDELSLDELSLDDLSLDDTLMSEEAEEAPAVEEETISDELSLDELSLDDLSLDDMLMSEETEEAPAAEEDMLSDDLNLDGLSLDEMGLGDLQPDEIGQDGDDMLALDDTDVESGMTDDFALEESGEDDEELSALLASMGGDEDLSEINDLLEKSDQGVTVDDDMLAMLDGSPDSEESGDTFDFFSEEGTEGEPENIRKTTEEELTEGSTPKTKKQKKKEEKERKRREKLAKKAKGKGNSQDGSEGTDELDNLVDGAAEGGEKQKKQGAFGKFVAFLLEEDDASEGSVAGDTEDVGLVIGNLSDENKEILDELSAEDKKNAKKKAKKEKKAKKGKKKEAEAAEASGDGEEGAEEAPKKPKKEKKKKKEKVIDEEPRKPEKKLSKKKVTSVFLFCATIAACIVVLTMLLPEQMEKQEARVAYDRNQYAQVFDLLYGKELNEEDEALLQKSTMILRMQRKLDSYENYTKLDMPLEALNALLDGVSRYQNMRESAELYNVNAEVSDIYGQILDALAESYGLSESDALEIVASGDDVTYSQRIQAVVNGDTFNPEEEDTPTGKQDVLPEEEEIIDRLQSTETE